MIVWTLEVEMPPCRQSSRINVTELKAQIVKKLGPGRAEQYFHHLKSFLSSKISKSEFDKLCFSTIGRQNVALHNLFIQSILKNAYQCKVPPSPFHPHSPVTENKQDSPSVGTGNDYRKFPHSPSPALWSSNIGDRSKFTDRLSPLGLHVKADQSSSTLHQGTNSDELISRPAENEYATISNSSDLQMPQHKSNAELVSFDGKTLIEVVSVEDGEEVEQKEDNPSTRCRSPVRAPLGILGNKCRSLQRNGFGASFLHPTSEVPETCSQSCELPDSGILRKRIEWKLESEGLLSVHTDFVDLLNNGLDAFLKRLIKQCMEITGARLSSHRHSSQVTGKIVMPGMNGLQPGQFLSMLSNENAMEYMQKPKHCFSASLLDFQVAMELNHQLLGEDWPVQLEKICLRASEE